MVLSVELTHPNQRLSHPKISMKDIIANKIRGPDFGPLIFGPNPQPFGGRDLDLSPLIARKRRVLSRSKITIKFVIVYFEINISFSSKAILYIWCAFYRRIRVLYIRLKLRNRKFNWFRWKEIRTCSCNPIGPALVGGRGVVVCQRLLKRPTLR